MTTLCESGASIDDEKKRETITNGKVEGEKEETGIAEQSGWYNILSRQRQRRRSVMAGFTIIHHCISLLTAFYHACRLD